MKFENNPSLYDWLELLSRFKVASLDQLQDIFPLKSVDLKYFEEKRILVRQDMPTLSGEMKTVLGLGRKGAEKVAEETGREVADIPHFSQVRFKRSMFTIEHELGITQVGLSLNMLSQKGFLNLIHWETSPQRIGTSVRVITHKGLDCIPLVADAFIGLRVNDQTHWLLLELDRATIDLKRMKRKFVGYQTWWKEKGPKHRFGLKNLRVLYLVPNVKRLNALKILWKEVSEHGGKGFIWFALHDVADTKHPDRWLGKHFHRVDFPDTLSLFN